MLKDLRLGVVQLTSTDNLAANLKAVELALLSAHSAGADLIIFPENTLYFRLSGSKPLSGPAWGGPELKHLRQMAEDLKTPFLLTTPILKEDAVKFINATLLFAPGKSPKVVYSKIHLFDVDVPGAPPVRESEHFEPGSQPAMIELAGWKVGLSICYDIRFAELYSHYAQKVDLILVPSAFLVPTGKAHWHVLLRARAIENQCFVAAPAQAGEHFGEGGSKRQTFGHSLVVDPWGQVLVDLENGPEVRVLDLKREKISEVRRQIPMESHRRL